MIRPARIIKYESVHGIVHIDGVHMKIGSMTIVDTEQTELQQFRHPKTKEVRSLEMIWEPMENRWCPMDMIEILDIYGVG